MKVKISAVSYLNTLPFIHGINNSDVKNNIDLSLDIPSECARKLIEDEVDLGLIPVAVIPKLNKHYIVSDFCIGADGKVDTVALFSDVPIEEIEEVYLDFHSRTSINLVQVLANKYWNISPIWLNAKEGFEQNIEGTTAGVIIGDRTFSLPKQYRYKYDLTEEWKKYTGKPFVFACWVANKELPKQFLEKLNVAFQKGINDLSIVVERANTELVSKEALSDYLNNKIVYQLTDEMREGLSDFLLLLK